MLRKLKSFFERTRRIDRLYRISDLLALVLSYRLALWLRFSAKAGPALLGFINGMLGWGGTSDLSGSAYEHGYFSSAFRYILPIALALYIVYSLYGLYEEHRFLKRRLMLWRVGVSNAGVLALIVAILYFRRDTWHPRGFFVFVFILNTGVTTLLRLIVRQTLNFLYHFRVMGRIPSVLVGMTPEARIVKEIIDGRHPQGLYVAAHLAATNGDDLAELEREIRESSAKTVILADESLSVATQMRVLELGARMDVAVKILTYKLSVLHLRAHEAFDTIRGVPLVHFEEPSATNKNNPLRMLLSRMFALAALVVLSPLLLIVALLVKLWDGGPILFVQERFGVNRRPFKMYKFRTMRVDAEAMLPELEDSNEAGAGLFKMKRDPRITPPGRFLRRFSIDELPQILNVLKGDMRIVGPRPLPHRDLRHYYEEWHYHRHGGLPGLTCLWQVSGRSEIDFENMCILDVYYLRNHSWPLDLRIVLRTVAVILFGRGAY